MNRAQLEHVIRAAAAITGVDDLYVIGSQAILASLPDAPPDVLRSVEADLYTLRDDADATLIDGTIGEGSPFHQTFGYHAHGVGPDTAVLPADWRERAIPIRTPTGATGWCPERHDLAVSKLVAGREKDAAFVASLHAARVLDPATVTNRLDNVHADARVLAKARSLWDRIQRST